MAALKASLDAVQSRDDDGAAAAEAPKKKPAAKRKPATKRKTPAKTG
jgi:hypothetical protein